MIYPFLLPSILLLSVIAYFLGVYRAQRIAFSTDEINPMHSLPVHYGVFVAMNCALPAILIFGVWKLIEDAVISSMVSHFLPAEFLQRSASELSLLMNEVKLIALNNADKSSNPTVAAAAGR